MDQPEIKSTEVTKLPLWAKILFFVLDNAVLMIIIMCLLLVFLTSVFIVLASVITIPICFHYLLRAFGRNGIGTYEESVNNNPDGTQTVKRSLGIFNVTGMLAPRER
ncbi:TPA: hypothetical protein DF272_00315 [Candidatus Falkowbacteria bacterium]|nr:hypothetical protein [Candidatus Falkowbacteria bacterium]